MLLAALVGVCYRAWLTTGLITAGDFPYFTQAHLSEGAPIPSLWDAGSSTGGYNIIDAPMFPVAMAAGLLAHLGFDWSAIERFLWIFPAVLIPCVATYALAMFLFARRMVAFVAALAIVMNSYIYLLYEGGQFGVAMGYGCLPLVVLAFAHGQRRARVRDFVPTGICMAVQAVYDVRSTYLSLGVLLLYALSCPRSCAARDGRDEDGDHERTITIRNVLWRAPWRIWRGGSRGLAHIAVALIVLAVLQLWWLLPAVFVQRPTLPQSYTVASAVAPLSLMHLSNGIALFHPFWFANNLSLAPINPLFFAMSLLVFGMLLSHDRDRRVLFLAVVALLAIFLVKGDNEPAGRMYDWLFLHFPGFSLFRDSSKFYQPLAFAYALLLGLAADRCYAAAVGRPNSGMGRGRVPKRVAARAALIPVTLAIAVIAVFPATPALFGMVRGTFAANPLPDDYAQFNAAIDSRRDFFRVLWVPARPRFATYSTLHPALDADQLTPCCVAGAAALASGRPWAWLSQSASVRALQTLSVRYIVVPELDAALTDVIGHPTVTGGVSSPIDAPDAAIKRALSGAREYRLGHLRVFELGLSYPLLYTAPESGVSMARLDGSQDYCVSRVVCVAAGPKAGVRDIVAQPAGHGVPIRTLAGSAVGYDVDVAAPTHPYYLVFNQTYDPNWLAYVEPGGADGSPWSTLFETPLPASEHVSANGYANAWLLRGAQRRGSYRIVLVYWPEWLAILGVMLAAFALLGYGMSVAVRRARVQPGAAYLGREDPRPPRKTMPNRFSSRGGGVHEAYK